MGARRAACFGIALLAALAAALALVCINEACPAVRVTFDLRRRVRGWQRVDCAKSASQDSFAYATYVGSVSDAQAATGLINSIFRTGTPHPIVVLVKEGILATVRKELSHSADNCQWVASRVLIVPAAHVPGPERGDWAQIRLFQLPYTKVLYVAAKSVVLERLDELFAVPATVAALPSERATSLVPAEGLLLLTPCEALYADVVEKLAHIDWRPRSVEVRS